VTTIRIPPQLRDAVEGDQHHERLQWLADLPAALASVATEWGLELEDPYEPGGQCAWVAPARDPAGRELVLKLGWRHPEAEHEADALRFWGGDGAIRCFEARTLEDTSALLLERCEPGIQLNRSTPEPEQDAVLAGLLRRLWARRPLDGHPFASLTAMCDGWAEEFERDLFADGRGLDPGLARSGIALLRHLPRTAELSVLLATDVHGGNVLSSRREPWLVIDPKPFVGDPAYDPVQHMLNCDQRLASDPVGLACRMADLLDLDRDRVRLWLSARCAQEALRDASMREPAHLLAA
jgi:streptomycin 6-kinase